MSKQELGRLEFSANSSKCGNWESLKDFLEENELNFSEKELGKFSNLCYILYEVIANTTVYDDGSYDITSIECGGKVYLPRDKD